MHRLINETRHLIHEINEVRLTNNEKQHVDIASPFNEMNTTFDGGNFDKRSMIGIVRETHRVETKLSPKQQKLEIDGIIMLY